MREFSYKLVTFTLIMAEGGVYHAELKRELNSLSKEIFDIDLRIQIFRAQDNATQEPVLKALKVEIQKKIVQLEIKLEYKKAQNKNRTC